MPARLAALSRLIAQRGITERDDFLCIPNVLCAQEADSLFPRHARARGDLDQIIAGLAGWDACLFTQTSLNEDGRPVRDPSSTTCLATFQPAAQFGVLLAAEARRRGIEHIRRPVVLGDGAAWIWNLADQHFPAATQIVDLYHAREHVHDLANLAARLLAGHRDDWLATRLEELDAGDTGAILAAGRALDFTGSLAGERDKALAYFEHNARRMRYHHFKSLGMFVGSGVVEAGCKSIGQRLKLSGMRWTLAGATGIATLRCLDAGHRWDEIWQRPHSQTAPHDLVTLAS